MSLFSDLRRVRWKLKKIQQDFLKGDRALERKLHLVKWLIVCREKRKGDLGVICLH